MIEGLSFGWRTAVLTVAVVQLIILAIALARQLRNRVANRTLAVLLAVLAGIVTPWLIGFAGFYDKWRWLTFAPLQITLAVGPLFYFYVHALVTGGWPDRWRRHLIAPAGQFAFYLGSFLLPFEAKMRWNDLASAPASLGFGVALIIGLIGYGVASRQLLSAYRVALAAARSDDHRFAARWLQAAIGAVGVLLIVWAGFLIRDAMAPLGYLGLMWLYLAIATIALFLGIEGWRHAALQFPQLADLAPGVEEPTVPRDWRAIGEAWADRVRAEGWAGDPELSLPVLARRLGTNTGHLSRALNTGLGMSFSHFVNGLRSEAVADMMARGRTDDLLELALDAGFSSKASFNRAFVARYGIAPSAYRKRLKT